MAEHEDLHRRKESLGQAATGAAMVGAGTGSRILLDRRLKAAKAPSSTRAAFNSAVYGGKRGYARVAGNPKPRGIPKASKWRLATHAPDLAGRTAARSLQAVGLPLAAYGAVNAVRAKPRKVRRVSREELAHHVVRQAAYVPTVERGQQVLTSKALTPAEQRKLDAHRRFGRTTSMVGGTLGLSALALRAPSGAKALARAAGKPKALGALARHEEAAVRHSNTLGIGAIGTGAAGSFNYAAQQKLERKAAIAKAGKAGLLGRAAARVNTRLDERALRTAEQIMPTGHTLPSGAEVRHHELEGRGRFGGRNVYTHVYGPDARGAKRPVGYVRTKQLPTKHVMVTGMQMNPKQRGKGYGTDLLETAQRNVKGAKTPGFIWRSAGYKADEGIKNTPQGHRTWQRKGVKYVPGIAFGHPQAAEGNVLRSQGYMSRKEKAKAIGHMTAARLGATTPDKVRALSPGTQEFTNETGQQWWARVKGGQPMLGRTRRAVGAGTVGGGAVYAHGRYEERKHPRGYGGKFSQKGVAKRDDRFLRGYKTRISPDAERGYKHLKQGRNEQAAEAVGSATMTGLGGWLLHHELKHGKVLHKNPGALIAAAGTVASAANARQNAAGARRYQQKITPIKAKARSRRAQGLYGPGRGLDPVDMSSARAKALSKAMEGSMDARATNLAQAMAVSKAVPGGKLVRRAAASFKRPPARITLPDRPPLGSTGARKEPALNRFGLTAEQHRDVQARAIDARIDARVTTPARRVDRPTAYRREGEPLHFGPAR